MKEEIYAKAIINIGGQYKEVELKLSPEDLILIKKSNKKCYSMGAKVQSKVIDAALEDYDQT